MKLSDFDYPLPKELIAQHPLSWRDGCRLMTLDRMTGEVGHRTFSDLTSILSAGDCLVLNDTQVIPARLYGKRRTGGKVEIFLLDPLGAKSPADLDLICEALVRPSARIDAGERIKLESGDTVEVLGQGKIGRLVRFERPADEVMKAAGHTPLPPYIDRPDSSADAEDYQTVFAATAGATASPTAGLHFTRELLGRLAAAQPAGSGVRVAYVTLHTSYGTFAPVKCDDVEKHEMHSERFILPAETIEAVRETRRAGGRVVAVGTTSARVLEHCGEQIKGQGSGVKGQGEQSAGYEGSTNLFIYPGYKFKIVDALITNFHLPKSTLLLLVSAFAGKDHVFEAYRQAVESKYRFFSYGDAMMIA